MIGSLFRGLCRALYALRTALPFIFLALLALIVLALLAPTTPRIARTAALVVQPEGDLVEQLDGDASARAWNELVGEGEHQTLVRDLIAAIDAAKDDNR